MSAKPRPKPVRATLVIALGVGLLVLPIAVCIGWCAFGADIQQYQNRKPFDPAVWKQTREFDRYDLAWDLYHGRLDGLTPAEVHELLGEPTYTDSSWVRQLPEFNISTANRGPDTWRYSLGPAKYEGLFSVGVARLHVDFENGRVVRVSKTCK